MKAKDLNKLAPFFYQFLGLGLPAIVGIATSSLIVKTTGISLFGQYSFLLGAVTLSYGVIGSAIDTIFQRSCRHEIITSVLLAKLKAWLAIMPVFLLISAFFQENYQAIILVGLGFLFQQVISSIVVLHRINSHDYRSIMPRLAPVTVLLVFINYSSPLEINKLAFLFATSWGIFSIYYILSNSKNFIVKEFDTSGLLNRSTGLIWATFLMTQIYGNADLFIIKYYHGNEIVGAYKIAYNFASIGVPLSGIVNFIYLSRMSESFKRKKICEIASQIKKQIFIAFGLGLILISGIILMLPYFANYLYADAGRMIMPPVIILAFALTFNTISMIYSYALLAFHQEQIIAKLTFIGISVYLILGLSLIPKYGDIGAASAMTITYFLLIFLYRRACWKFLYSQSPQ